jgi:5-(carboxyamino)imidazole ribonucleotide synthase
MSAEPILPGAFVGILGSGQLGRMLALEARRMGYGVRVLSPDKDTPCGQIADTEIVADYRDVDAVRAFAETVSVVTYEFENVPSETVSAVEAAGVPVRPGAPVLHIAQNRLREKQFFQGLGIATPRFARIAADADITEAIQAAGLPAVLKTAGSGYDGKGQRMVRTEAEVRTAFAELRQVECILEGFVDFAWEGSVVAARSVSGEFADYGLVHNEHAHHILDVTTTPAPSASAEVSQQATKATRAVMDALDVVGVLCVEFFVTASGELIANEMAPRPHNSGHWTQNGAVTNQFEQQLRAVCGLPLGSTAPLYPAFAMANLLGDVWQNGTPNFTGMLAEFPDAKLHLYGKAEARPGRKMGHLNLAGTSPEDAATRARACREALRR